MIGHKDAIAPLRLRLHEAHLRYPLGQEVHTAASGRVAALHEIFLEIEDREAGVTGVGEVRANATFITGTPSENVVPGVIAFCRLLDLSSVENLAASFAAHAPSFPKICRAVVDNALVDLLARRAGLAAAVFLGGKSQPRGLACNNCVFWGSDADMAANLDRYIMQGFRKIKLRVGIGTLDDDERRLAFLRRRSGELELSLDANGAWSADQALAALDRLRRYGPTYIEQPTHKGDWPALERVAHQGGLLVMIDEGLQEEEDVARVCANAGRIAAHLKICKAGGVRPLLEIGRRFGRAGVPYVMGQMNEGAIATAIAVHAGMALTPMVGELYGALGIENDVAEGVSYRDGRVRVPGGPGIGLTLRGGAAAMLWSRPEDSMEPPGHVRARQRERKKQ
jgi:L-alanine-DL-glutamate epimerase-like enolase superfamily enzyme